MNGLSYKKGICGACDTYGSITEHHKSPGLNDTIVNMCFPCHVDIHSLQGDWATWGRRGGRVTQKRHPHVRRNLKQYRGKA